MKKSLQDHFYSFIFYFLFVVDINIFSIFINIFIFSDFSKKNVSSLSKNLYELIIALNKNDDNYLNDQIFFLHIFFFRERTTELSRLPKK